MTTRTTTTEPRTPRSLWPLAVVLALAAMIGSSLSMLALAIAYPDPTLTADSWSEERVLLAALRARERGRARGLSLTLETQVRGGEVEVVLALRDSLGAALVPERVVVRRERPSEGGFDAELELVPSAEGFRGTIELPRAGRWRITARAELGDARVERFANVWREP